MKRLILIINLFLLFSPFAEATSCRISSKFLTLYSLSGPLTVGLKKIGLLSDPRLAGISYFHPIHKNEFKGERIPGGIYLSYQLAKKMRGAKIVFDHSYDLKKMMQKFDLDFIEFNTLGLTPLEVNEKVISLLVELTEFCHVEIDHLRKEAHSISAQLLKSVPENFKAIFFLGSLNKFRFPEIVINRDGVLKWLVKLNKIQSYPSELAYVPWSSKMINNLSHSYHFIGIKDSGSDFLYELKNEENAKWNFSYPGALVPGITQLEAWLYLFKKLNKKS
jgi:hypothetical protein